MAELYTQYAEEVQEYMKNVILCLRADYGENIPESWRISLDLIADNYEIYLKAKNDIMKNGLLREDNQGRTFKNQNISIMNMAQRNITDLLKAFALTPMSKSKMKVLDSSKFDEDAYIDYLSDN